MYNFKTIQENNVSAEIIEKKSRFIANIFHVETSEEAENWIKQMKKKYYDAKHNCFAYLIFNENKVLKKFSDDGEPGGTAGAPMLEILEKKGIYNVVVIVTRYFGGILLGTGGLVRAYSESLKQALSKATIINEESGYEVEVKLDYSNFDKFQYYCNKKNINMVNCTYSDIVICKIEINLEDKKALLNDINDKNSFGIISFDIVRQKNITKLSNNID